MKSKLSVAALVFVFGLLASVSVQAADVQQDLASLSKLPAAVQKTIYQSSIDLNKEAEMELSTIGLANSSLQDAIMAKLDQYADKGGVVPVYTFPTDKIEEVAALLAEHERANERMEKIGERMKKTHELIGTMKHKLSELE